MNAETEEGVCANEGRVASAVETCWATGSMVVESVGRWPCNDCLGDDSGDERPGALKSSRGDWRLVAVGIGAAARVARWWVVSEHRPRGTAWCWQGVELGDTLFLTPPLLIRLPPQRQAALSAPDTTGLLQGMPFKRTYISFCFVCVCLCTHVCACVCVCVRVFM